MKSKNTRRRREAERRKLARDARSTAEQLALIEQRRGDSKKERARLLS